MVHPVRARICIDAIAGMDMVPARCGRAGRRSSPKVEAIAGRGNSPVLSMGPISRRSLREVAPAGKFPKKLQFQHFDVAFKHIFWYNNGHQNKTERNISK